MRHAAFGLAALLLAVSPVDFGVGRAAAEDAHLEAEALQALDEIFDALMSGDSDRIEPYLAEEFQIVRSNGAGYGKQEYLTRSIPRIESEPVFHDPVITRNGDIVVARLEVEIEEYLDGKKAEARFPHLFVFRVTPDGWKVVAAANFAALAED